MRVQKGILSANRSHLLKGKVCGFTSWGGEVREREDGKDQTQWKGSLMPRGWMPSESVEKPGHCARLRLVFHLSE